MRLVRRRHTSAERRLASALRKSGLVFKTHKLVFGCTPDILFVKTRVAVFVDGDFWHGRLLIDRGHRALARSFRVEVREFWVAKIERNARRDARQARQLRRNGWAVVRLWEKDVLRDVGGAVLAISRRVHTRRIKLKLPRGAF